MRKKRLKVDARITILFLSALFSLEIFLIYEYLLIPPSTWSMQHHTCEGARWTIYKGSHLDLSSSGIHFLEVHGLLLVPQACQYLFCLSTFTPSAWSTLPFFFLPSALSLALLAPYPLTLNSNITFPDHSLTITMPFIEFLMVYTFCLFLLIVLTTKL